MADTTTPPVTTSQVASTLASLDWKDPQSIKRLLVLVAGVAAVAAGHPLGLSDLQLELVAGMVITFLGLSNLKTVAVARANAAGAAAAGTVTTPAVATDVINAAPKVLLAVLLVGALLLPGPARAQSCDELLDAGTPAQARLLPAGAVLDAPATCMDAARTCEVGRRVARAEARAAELEARAVGPAWWVVAVTAVVAVAGGAALTYSVCRAAHCAP